jgi:flavin reductase (DIM6/NTAB) family NADH-FMN oxidoreductase RutF
MDLMGPAGESLWLFALRSTTPAVEVIRRTRRITVSAVPVEMRDEVYSLGRNHRVPYADAAALPFTTIPSPSFGLPVPEEALRVTDFDVVDLIEPGSHTVFVGRQCSHLQQNAGLGMCHVQGFYQEWSSRRGRTAGESWNRGES